jgi:hypothetical protein
MTKEKCMNRGLDEVFPPTPEVWAELAQHEMAGDHQFGSAVRFLEEGGTDRNLLAKRLGIKVDYADWLLNHARKMKRGTIRVVVSDKNDGRETASNQTPSAAVCQRWLERTNARKGDLLIRRS